jgi:hypothetical protein
MRDPERQYRFSNSFQVSYPDFPTLTNPVRSIVIHQERGKHDIVEIYYSRFSSAYYKAIKTGVAVEISWKNDKVSEKFIGYTTDASHITAQQLNRDTKITCVGASYPLKERVSKIWTNKTASEIVTEVAKKFNLKPMVTSSSIRFAQQSLSGHSYWEKLNELAKRIGYGVQVVGAELHFHPIDKMIDQFMTTIPIMSFLDPLEGPESNIDSPTLMSFEPIIGDHIESLDYSRSTNTVGGIDPVTGNIYVSKTSSNKVGKNIRKNTKDPLFSTVESHTVIESSLMAQKLSEARAQHGRFSIPAKGVGQGDPRIAPWRTIEVRGTGDVSDGFWVVEKAEHVLHGDGRYLVEFTCLSDGTGSNKPSITRPSSAGSVPSRNITNEMSTPNKNKPTSTKLTSTSVLVNQSAAGYTTTPRRWVGK